MEVLLVGPPSSKAFQKRGGVALWGVKKEKETVEKKETEPKKGGKRERARETNLSASTADGGGITEWHVERTNSQPDFRDSEKEKERRQSLAAPQVAEYTYNTERSAEGMLHKWAADSIDERLESMMQASFCFGTEILESFCLGTKILKCRRPWRANRRRKTQSLRFTLARRKERFGSKKRTLKGQRQSSMRT